MANFIQNDLLTSTSIFISLVVKKLVDDTATALNREIFFDWGHYTEVFRNITEKSGGTTIKRKYPLVWLVMDMTEDRYGDIEPSLYGSAPAHILIINDTKQDATMEQRERDVFDKILNPIYDELINQIKNSKYLSNSLPLLLKHKKTNRYYWDGKDGDGVANLFGDYVDAIQIKNLVMNFKQQNCQQLKYL